MPHSIGPDARKRCGHVELAQVVAASPCTRPSEIAIAQDVHPSQVTRQIRELERIGLVRVRADQADKRSCRVSITKAGIDELKNLTEVGLDRFASFVADWGKRRGQDVYVTAPEARSIQDGNRDARSASRRQALGSTERLKVELSAARNRTWTSLPRSISRHGSAVTPWYWASCSRQVNPGILITIEFGRGARSPSAICQQRSRCSCGSRSDGRPPRDRNGLGTGRDDARSSRHASWLGEPEVLGADCRPSVCASEK